MHLSGLAVRLSWLTLVLLLFTWSVEDVVRTITLPVQLLVLSAGRVVDWAVYLAERQHEHS
jgi:hypothetical protein